jgi:hypothetical protein
LYLNYGSGYRNLHVWHNCIELHPYAHTGEHVALIKSE